MKLEKQLLINMEWSSNKNYWSTGNEVKRTTIDQQGMKLERQLLINSERVMKFNGLEVINNYWSTGNEVITTPIDQQGMKSEQQLLINREWS